MRKINLKMMIIAVITVFLAINLNLKYNEKDIKELWKIWYWRIKKSLRKKLLK